MEAKQILDSQGPTFVIGREQNLEYANPAAQPIAKALGLTGQALCHKQLFGLEEPCPDCPANTGDSRRFLLKAQGQVHHAVVRPFGQGEGVIYQFERVGTLPDAQEANNLHRLVQLLLQENNQQEAMLKIYETLLDATLDITEIATVLYSQIQSFIPCDALSISLYDAETQTITVVADKGHSERGYSIKGDILPADLPHIQQMIKTGEPVVIYDTKSDTRWKKTEQTDWINSLLAAPLVITEKDGSKKVIGFLNLDNAKAHSFTKKDERRLQMIGSQLALAIRNSQLHEEVKDLSLHDGLTGLYNRSFLDVEIIRLQRGRTYPISIIMLDVDGLKLVNDTFGHAVGDELLKTVANILRLAFRDDDIIARLSGGGDEFAVLLPNTDSDKIIKVRKRLNDVLEKYNVEHGTNISFSVGYATTAGKNEPLNVVLQRADEMMYKEKGIKPNRRK